MTHLHCTLNSPTWVDKCAVWIGNIFVYFNYKKIQNASILPHSHSPLDQTLLSPRLQPHSCPSLINSIKATLFIYVLTLFQLFEFKFYHSCICKSKSVNERFWGKYLNGQLYERKCEFESHRGTFSIKTYLFTTI